MIGHRRSPFGAFRDLLPIRPEDQPVVNVLGRPHPERRRKRLMQIQRQISKKRKKALVGKEFDLVLEGTSEETDLLLEGRTAMHAPEIDGKVFVNECQDGADPQPGQFYRCEITAAHDYDLVAKIL